MKNIIKKKIDRKNEERKESETMKNQNCAMKIILKMK